MVTVKYLEKENDWQEGTTTYWFELDGYDDGTDVLFDEEVYGVRYREGDVCYLYQNGESLDVSNELLAIKRLCIVTDEMIKND